MPGLGGEAILVVEDEPTVRMLVVETLEEHGYTTIEVGDALAALEIVKAPGQIDLMLTDITLPGQNGRELAEAAKRLRPELKILFMTGYAHNVDMSVTGAGSGAIDIITKPFSLDGLARKVRTVIAG
ncbi:MAG: response regulator [Rhodospirillales bacterium]|nr:response regulator [Rhodospirillales bacterium]MDE2318185.1 response regulator [Rhodospirillales bacterium]